MLIKDQLTIERRLTAVPGRTLLVLSYAGRDFAIGLEQDGQLSPDDAMNLAQLLQRHATEVTDSVAEGNY